MTTRRDQGLTRVDEAECDSEPGAPANHQTGYNRGDCYGTGDREAGIRSKRDQRADRDARGRPEEGHSDLSAKRQAEPSSQEIGNADRDGESDPV